jgi:hypothetical protein
LRHRFAITRTFHDGGTDVGHSLGVVELEATGFSALGQQASREYQEFVFFAGCEFHGATFRKSDSSLTQATSMPQEILRTQPCTGNVRIDSGAVLNSMHKFGSQWALSRACS